MKQNHQGGEVAEAPGSSYEVRRQTARVTGRILRNGVAPTLMNRDEAVGAEEYKQESVVAKIDRREGDENASNIPISSYLTPPPLLSKRLILYDRYSTLVPLISVHALRTALPDGRDILEGFNFRVSVNLTKTGATRVSRFLFYYSICSWG